MEEVTKRTRVKRAPERYREDGTYYNGPKNPQDYFKHYYNTKGAEEVQCPCCQKTGKRSYLYKHSRTKKCNQQVSDTN